MRRAAAVLTVVVSILLVAGPPARAAGITGGRRVHVYATYYGWFDNTPPGCATAYSGCAGGIGTFADPITFASDPAEFPVGTVLYDPLVQKYFRMGDACQECELDWSGHGPNGGPRLHHIDLWLGGEGGDAFDAISCEDALTRARPNGSPQLTTFLADPPAGLPVSAQPLFDPATGACFGGAMAASTTGRYRNQATGRCLAAPAVATAAPATVASATTAGCGDATTRTVFQASFIVDGRQCLRTTGSRPGARIAWAGCDGDAREQWEVNPDGTITWVQDTLCVTAAGDRVTIARCTGGAATQRWDLLTPGS